MARDRSEICDARGRHISVTHRRIVREGDADAPEASAEREAGAILDELVGRLHRLGPSRTDPEKFHSERSDIAHRLDRLARALPRGLKVPV